MIGAARRRRCGRGRRRSATGSRRSTRREALQAQGMDDPDGAGSPTSTPRATRSLDGAGAPTEPEVVGASAVPAALPRDSREPQRPRRPPRGAGRPRQAAAESDPLPLRWPVAGQPVRGYRRARRRRRPAARPPGRRPRRSRWSRPPRRAPSATPGRSSTTATSWRSQPRRRRADRARGPRARSRPGPARRCSRGALLGLLGGRPPDAQEYLMLGPDANGR